MNSNHANPEGLVFASQESSPFISYALHLISVFIGKSIYWNRSNNNASADIYYGEDRNYNCKIVIPKERYLSVQSVPKLPGKLELESAFIKNSPFQFDIFSALEFWLADMGNSSCTDEAFDRHERLKADYSAQATYGLVETPIVNAYLILLRHWIENRTGIVTKNHFPLGKKCAIVLTHDVDTPINPGDPSHSLWLSGKSLSNRDFPQTIYHIKKVFQKGKWGLTNPGQRHWLFREVMNAESQHTFKSTFFFSTRSHFSREASGFDVDYDISSPRFKHLFREINSREMEIGLHSSYNANTSYEAILGEKEILSRYSNSEIKGNRHHCWHMGRPFWKTLESHAKAGLRYDSSIAFNESPGLRLGIAYPFFPWNPLTKQEIPTLQIPIIAMDGSFYYREGQTVVDTLTHMSRLLTTLKEYEGVATLNWHVRTSFPGSTKYQSWGEGYLAILDLLAADPEVWVQNCTGVLTDYLESWQKVRISNASHEYIELKQ